MEPDNTLVYHRLNGPQVRAEHNPSEKYRLPIRLRAIYEKPCLVPARGSQEM